MSARRLLALDLLTDTRASLSNEYIVNGYTSDSLSLSLARPRLVNGYASATLVNGIIGKAKLG